MSKDQIFGFAVWVGVFAVVWGRSVAAKMRARFNREQIELAKYRHPGSK